MASQRDTLIAAMEARLKTVRKAAGYRTDLGRYVRTWQAAPTTWDALPAVQVSDPSSEADAPAYGRVLHKISISVEVLLPGGTAASTLRDYAADILQAVGTDPTWSGAAQQTQLKEVVLEVGKADVVAAGVAVGLEVEVETGLWIL